MHEEDNLMQRFAHAHSREEVLAAWVATYAGEGHDFKSVAIECELALKRAAMFDADVKQKRELVTAVAFETFDKMCSVFGQHGDLMRRVRSALARAVFVDKVPELPPPEVTATSGGAADVPFIPVSTYFNTATYFSQQLQVDEADRHRWLSETEAKAARTDEASVKKRLSAETSVNRLRRASQAGAEGRWQAQIAEREGEIRQLKAELADMSRLDLVRVRTMFKKLVVDEQREVVHGLFVSMTAQDQQMMLRMFMNSMSWSLLRDVVAEAVQLTGDATALTSVIRSAFSSGMLSEQAIAHVGGDCLEMALTILDTDTGSASRKMLVDHLRDLLGHAFGLGKHGNRSRAASGGPGSDSDGGEGDKTGRGRKTKHKHVQTRAVGGLDIIDCVAVAGNQSRVIKLSRNIAVESKAAAQAAAALGGIALGAGVDEVRAAEAAGEAAVAGSGASAGAGPGASRLQHRRSLTMPPMSKLGEYGAAHSGISSGAGIAGGLSRGGSHSSLSGSDAGGDAARNKVTLVDGYWEEGEGASVEFATGEKLLQAQIDAMNSETRETLLTLIAGSVSGTALQAAAKRVVKLAKSNTNSAAATPSGEGLAKFAAAMQEEERSARRQRQLAVLSASSLAAYALAGNSTRGQRDGEDDDDGDDDTAGGRGDDTGAQSSSPGGKGKKGKGRKGAKGGKGGKRGRAGKGATQKMSLANVLALIADCYEKKVAADAVDDRNGEPRQSLSDFVKDFFINKYGFPAMADAYLRGMVSAIGKWRSRSSRLRLFGLMVGLMEPNDERIFTVFRMVDVVLHLYTRLFPKFNAATLRRRKEGQCFVPALSAQAALDAVFPTRKLDVSSDKLRLDGARREALVQAVALMQVPYGEVKKKSKRSGIRASGAGAGSLVSGADDSRAEAEDGFFDHDVVVDADAVASAAADAWMEQTEVDMKRLRDMYIAYDTDNSGDLSFSEFGRLLREGCAVSQDKLPQRKMLELFKEMCAVSAEERGANGGDDDDLSDDEAGDAVSADAFTLTCIKYGFTAVRSAKASSSRAAAKGTGKGNSASAADSDDDEDEDPADAEAAASTAAAALAGSDPVAAKAAATAAADPTLWTRGLARKMTRDATQRKLLLEGDDLVAPAADGEATSDPDVDDSLSAVGEGSIAEESDADLDIGPDGGSEA